MKEGRKRPISHRDVIVDNWQGRCLVTRQIQRDMARKSNSPHGYFVEECSKHNTNLKVSQNIQQGIPYVVLVVFKAFFRRQCGRGGGPFFFRNVIDNRSRRKNMRGHASACERGPADTRAVVDEPV